MKKMNMMIPFAALSIAGGAFLYSYSKKHPIKTKMAMNKVENIIKDFK